MQAQYILIHQALLEHNLFGETEIHLSELHGTLSLLKEKNSDGEPTLMEDEFEVGFLFLTFIFYNSYLSEREKKKTKCGIILLFSVHIKRD